MIQNYYIKIPLHKRTMISICDENTDEVLATAETPRQTRTLHIHNQRGGADSRHGVVFFLAVSLLVFLQVVLEKPPPF